ncbi:MAG: RecX family transcriptional regulator [Chloroflexi bacterium]|nr:RecX family transcriptional regulator [Chloroflexota bacterium]
MTGTITALRYQKRDTERVNVYIDGQFAFGLAAILAARLRVGQTLSGDEIAKYRVQDDVEKAHGRALNFLSYRPRSEYEVRQYLRKRDLDEDIIDSVVERLTRADLVNDDEFARYWVENRSQFRPRSLRALQYELRQKGVSDEAISRALSDVDEELMVRKIALASARRFKRLAPQDFRRKLTAHLARKGFSYDLIKPLVDEMLDSTRYEMLSDIESEEMDHGW